MAIAVFLVGINAGCSKERTDPVQADKEALPGRSQCHRQWNRPDHPCQVSIYELVASPARYEGMYVDVVLYQPAGTRLVFLSKDAAEHEDYSSSLLILSAQKAATKVYSSHPGYARVVARFRKDVSDHGVGHGVYRQLGVLDDVQRVMGLRSMRERQTECAELGCVVKYADGSEEME